jgi:hypothetical protein
MQAARVQLPDGSILNCLSAPLVLGRSQLGLAGEQACIVSRRHMSLTQLESQGDVLLMALGTSSRECCALA